MKNDVLIIGDPHAHPDYDNSRFEMLGKYIAEHQPETIVCLGDIADLASLRTEERGSKSFEGKQYHRDVEATKEADRLLWGAVEMHNKQARLSKRKQYKPKAIMLLGNHEDRITRYANSHPYMVNTLSLDDLQLGWRWEVIPFKEVYVDRGICYSHYFVSGLMERAIGGENPARLMLRKAHTSCVAGHSHLLDFVIDTRVDGKKIFALSAGCFAHPKMIEGWNQQASSKYWHGVVHLHGVEDGWAREFCFIHYDRLVSKYG